MAEYLAEKIGSQNSNSAYQDFNSTSTLKSYSGTTTVVESINLTEDSALNLTVFNGVIQIRNSGDMRVGCQSDDTAKAVGTIIYLKAGTYECHYVGYASGSNGKVLKAI